MWEDAANGRVEWQNEGGNVYSTRSASRLFGVYRGVLRFLTVEDLRSAAAKTRKGSVSNPTYGFAMSGSRLFVRLPQAVNPNDEHLLFSSPSWNDGGDPRPVIAVED